MLFSNIETGIGCITSSIPSLRKLIRGGGGSTNDATGVSNKAGESTRDRFRNPTDGGFSLTTVKGRPDDNKWERLRDGDDENKLLASHSSKGGIRAEYTYVVESTKADSISDQSRL